MGMLRIAAALLFMALGGCATQMAAGDAARSELAPTGKIRLAVPANNPNYLNLPSAQPPYSGVAVDIGNALSKRVGAPLEIVPYQSFAALLADATTGKWDAALLGIEESRRATMEFSPPYAVTQNSYLVPAGSALMTIADVDRKGVRVAAVPKTMQHNHLQATLRNATLVGLTSLGEALKAGQADVVATNRPSAEALAKSMPGYRVVPGSFMDIGYGLAVPKGRSAAAAVAEKLIRDMRDSGEITAMLVRHKISGLTAPAN